MKGTELLIWEAWRKLARTRAGARVPLSDFESLLRMWGFTDPEFLRPASIVFLELEAVATQPKEEEEEEEEPSGETPASS